MVDNEEIFKISLVVIIGFILITTISYFFNLSCEDKYDETIDRMKEKYILEMQTEIDEVGCGQSIERFYASEHYTSMYQEICTECNNEFSIIWDYKSGFGSGYYEDQCKYDVEKAVLAYRRDVCAAQFDLD